MFKHIPILAAAAVTAAIFTAPAYAQTSSSMSHATTKHDSMSHSGMSHGTAKHDNMGHSSMSHGATKHGHMGHGDSMSHHKS